MKKEYDFSRGQRGLFYRKDARLNIPVYLDSDVEAYVSEIAREKGTDVNSLVNDWLKKNVELIRSAR